MTRGTAIALVMACLAGPPALAQQTPSTVSSSSEPERTQFRWNVGAEIGAAKLIDFGGTNLGFGIGVRGGIEILAPGALAFIPEVALGYARWTTEDSLQPDFTNDWTLSLLAGMRLAGRSPSTVPWFAFHVGLAHSDAGGTFCDSQDCSSNHLGFDAGAGVAFRTSPNFKVGLFAKYSRRDITDSLGSWLSFGVEGYFAR